LRDSAVEAMRLEGFGPVDFSGQAPGRSDWTGGRSGVEYGHLARITKPGRHRTRITFLRRAGANGANGSVSGGRSYSPSLLCVSATSMSATFWTGRSVSGMRLNPWCS
jgi:hypothetical protein